MPVLLRDAQNAADCVVVLGSTNKYNRRPPPCQPRPGSPLATNRIIQHAPSAPRSSVDLDVAGPNAGFAPQQRRDRRGPRAVASAVNVSWLISANDGVMAAIRPGQYG